MPSLYPHDYITAELNRYSSATVLCCWLLFLSFRTVDPSRCNGNELTADSQV